jgi:hypothetical protein
MNAIILKGAALRFHKVAPRAKTIAHPWSCTIQQHLHTGLSHTTANGRRQKYICTVSSSINGVLYTELTVMSEDLILASYLSYDIYKFNFSDLYFYTLS